MAKTKPAGQRFEYRRRSKQLVLSARITLDPRQDAGIITLLSEAERGGVASLIRTALRTCYQAASFQKTKRANPRIEVLEGGAGVTLSGPDQAIVIYNQEIQRVITELAAAQANLNHSAIIPEGVTLPLVAQRE